jgi:hypothetical protein
LDQATLVMGRVPVHGAEEAEVVEQECQLLEAAIDTMQDKVHMDKFHKARQLHEEKI